MIKLRWARVLTLTAIAWYLLLITVHYFNQRPLWNDEACVLANIQNLRPREILSQPLTHVQQFPRLYLLLIQKISAAWDRSLLSLRFLPFVFMSTAFLVWLRLAGDVLQKERDHLTFVLCWAASMPLIYYAAELKQYSMDVLAVGLFLLFSTRQQKIKAENPSVYPVLLALLPLLGFFSYAIFLMFVFPLFNSLRLQGPKKNNVLIYLSSCVTVIALVYWFDMRIGNGAALREYWHDYFISFASVGEFFKTFGEGVNNLVSRWFSDFPKWVRMPARFFMAFGFVYMILGFRKAFKKDGQMFIAVGTVALVVFIELALLGALKVYAFSVPRTSLFFCPMLLLLTVQALGIVRERWKYVYWPVQIGFWAYLLFVCAGISLELFKGDLGAQTIIWPGH